MVAATAVDRATMVMKALSILLIAGSVNALSTPAPTTDRIRDKCGVFEHRLVDHVDQLQQRRPQRRHHQQQLQFERSSGNAALQGPADSPSIETTATTSAMPTTPADIVFVEIPPPHLFRVPAPGGDICLIVDEKGGYHAVRDAFPPLGLPVSETGVVDSEVNAIGDTLFGTRFHLSDGTLRGPWCPGGTAGPLMRIARRLSPRLRRTVSDLARWIPSARLLFKFPKGSSAAVARAVADSPLLTLEVLPLTEQPDGCLTVTLPSFSSATKTGNGRVRRSAHIYKGDRQLEKERRTSWVESCGLAGYDF